MDLSFAKSDSYDTGDSQPWGAKEDSQSVVFGGAGSAESGFYDNRDDMVGGTDTRWNTTPGTDDMDAANWASYGDTAPTFNSASGLDGAPGVNLTHFSGTMSQGSLAGGSNPDTSYGH